MDGAAVCSLRILVAAVSPRSHPEPLHPNEPDRSHPPRSPRALAPGVGLRSGEDAV